WRARLDLWLLEHDGDRAIASPGGRASWTASRDGPEVLPRHDRRAPSQGIWTRSRSRVRPYRRDSRRHQRRTDAASSRQRSLRNHVERKCRVWNRDGHQGHPRLALEVPRRKNHPPARAAHVAGRRVAGVWRPAETHESRAWFMSDALLSLPSAASISSD